MRNGEVRDTHKYEEYGKIEGKLLRHNSLAIIAFV